MRLRISARRSDLARLQALLVGEELQAKNPSLEIEYTFKESVGDINLTDPLWKAPEKGVFTEDFYQDLAEEKCDIVVHSWKDLPIQEKPLTWVAGTLERADARDVLLFKKSSRKDRSQKIKILSSSPRRNFNLTPFLKWSLPFPIESVEFESVRGNIPTRVKKFIEGPADGLIVAKAALDRLCVAPQAEFAKTRNFLLETLPQLHFQVLPLSINPPCAGQGALALECRRTDHKTIELINTISHKGVFENVSKEREILKGHGGGCHQKIGIWINQHETGVIKILKGVTEEGTTLNQETIVLNRQIPREKFSQLLSIGDFQSNTRSELKPHQPAENGWIVSRSNSLPKEWSTDNKFIWTAGLKTWKNLAARGVWVHGTYDGLGEETIYMGFANPNWIKLCHSEAKSTIYPTQFTYSVHYGPLKAELVDQNACYFWRSFSEFKAATDQHSLIKSAWHACGPGSTYENLKKYVTPDRLFTFFDERDWKNQCQNQPQI